MRDDLGPMRTETRPIRVDSKPVKADFSQAYFGPVRADLEQ